MSFGKGSNTTTSSTAPNPAAMAAYSGLLDRAGNVANTPYTPYTGELVAPVNAQQQTGIGNINSNAGFAQPYIGQAAGYATAAAQPVTAAQIAGFQNPYTQAVVNATQAQFANQNAQQQAQLTGNAAAQGALGGDRVGVAQGILAGQQSLAQAPVIAGLYSSGYNTALSTALAEQQAQANAAYSLGNLGVAGQNAALTGANAQIGAGTLQQQTQQATDAARLQQFYQQQAYPFQTTQWLAGIDTGVGSQMGGTSQTTPPAPNPWNTLLGLGVAGLGAFAKDGGRIKGFATGGVPYADVAGYVPASQITRGSGAPKAPGVPAAAAPNWNSYAAAGKGLGHLLDGSGNPEAPLDLTNGFTSGEALGSLQDIGSAPQAGFGLGALYAKGGIVRGVVPAAEPIRLRRGYDDGGPVTLAGFGTGSILPPTFDQRFAMPQPPVDPAAYNVLQDYGTTQPQAQGSGLTAPHMEDIPLPRPRPGLALDDAGGVPALIARGPAAAAAPADFSDLPPGFSGEGPTAGVAAPAGAEAPPTRSGLFGLNLSPAARQGLLAAGFGLMASRSPYLGQAIGEGGLSGLAAYSGEQKQEMAQKKTQADIDRGKQQLAQAAKAEADRIAIETKRLQQSETQHQQTLGQRQAQLAELRRQHDMSLKAPVKYGETRSGVPLMALPRLNDKGGIDYYPIDAQSGTISPTPLGQSAPQPPALSPGPTATPPAPGASNAIPPSAARMAALDTGTVTDAPPVEIRAQAPTASPDARDEAFLAKIAKDDPRYAAELKGIADYRINPAGIASLRGNRRERLMQDILTYDPTYDQRRYNQTNRAIAGFWQSPEGRATRSLSVSVDHLGNLEDLGQALQNGNIPVVNRFTQWAKQNLGYEGPVNFDFARQIVADEIAKAVIGGQNAEGDRRGLQDMLSRANSPEQLVGVIRTAKQLMAGQLNGLRQGYETATGLHNFNTWITPRARSEIEAAANYHAAAGANAAPAAAPRTLSAQDQQALDWAKANPSDPRAAKIRQRLGVP